LLGRAEPPFFQTRPALICRAGFFRAGPAFFLPARLFFAGPVFRLLGRLFLPDQLVQTDPVEKSRGFKALSGSWPAKPALCTALVEDVIFSNVAQDKLKIYFEQRRIYYTLQQAEYSSGASDQRSQTRYW